LSATTTGGDQSCRTEQRDGSRSWNRGAREAEIERVDADEARCCSGSCWLDGQASDRQGWIGQPEASEGSFIVEVLEDAPDFHFLPVGNAGNYSAYFKGYSEELERGAITKLPRMFGFQAAGSAPFVLGHPVKNPETLASAIRIGNPASWALAINAHKVSDGYFGSIDDAGILAAQRILSAEVGIFVEPASAISVAGLLERADAGKIPAGSVVVLTVTGHGLKDPQWALRKPDGTDISPTVVPVDVPEIADVLGLVKGGTH
jgi:threonine synthase